MLKHERMPSEDTARDVAFYCYRENVVILFSKEWDKTNVRCPYCVELIVDLVIPDLMEKP